MSFFRSLMMAYVAQASSSTPQPTITWSVQSGSWTEGTNSSAYDGKQFTSVSPGSNGSTVIRCTFSNVKSITFNCVYNGENNYDYLTVGALDTACTRTSYGTSLKGTSGTDRDITFTCDEGEHYVEFCYSKDSSVDTSPDCAVVYLKNLLADSGNNLIPFTIGDTQYQAEEGMTWSEFVNSAYNIDGFSINSQGFIENIARHVIHDGDNLRNALGNDVIRYSGYYSWNTDGGSGPA